VIVKKKIGRRGRIGVWPDVVDKMLPGAVLVFTDINKLRAFCNCAKKKNRRPVKSGMKVILKT